MTNNTTQHTPGPWGTIDGAEIYPVHGDKSHVTLAHVVGPWSESEWYTDKREALANARLIAAAPALLEALEAVVNRADKTSGAWLPDGQTIERCRAAIRKAKGSVTHETYA